MAMTGLVRLSTSSTRATRLLAPHVERRDGAGEEHGVPDGKDGELVAELDGLFLGLGGRRRFFSDMSATLSMSR